VTTNLATIGGDPWLPITFALVVFGSFSWALRGHFETHGYIPNRMRLLSIFSLLSCVNYIGLLVWCNYDKQLWTTVGLAGFALSLVLFWWTVIATRGRRPSLAYTDSDPDIVYTTGPYAQVRHPFYLSYIIFWISSALVAGRWQWMPAVILTSWYIRIARAEEKRFRSSVLSTHYDSYRAQTGMLLPRFSGPK
jgi:protein-S-isoprenylcysteine O-methyltransferase Ste14